MTNFSFRYLPKQDFSRYAPALFGILHSNMSVIAPTGNSYDEDFHAWSDVFGHAFVERIERSMVLIEADGILVGFFAYACKDHTFRMEEIQFSEEYKGKYGLFRRLYDFVTNDLPEDLLYVEAYAHTSNTKSIAVLHTLGLKNIGTTPNGNCFHFKGAYEDYLSWLKHS